MATLRAVARDRLRSAGLRLKPGLCLAYWAGGDGMATRKPIKWAKIGKVAGLVVAGVLALAAGAIPVWNQVPIRRLPPRDGSHEEDGEDQGQSGQES
jgi:hypothetical protein